MADDLLDDILSSALDEVEKGEENEPTNLASAAKTTSVLQAENADKAAKGKEGEDEFSALLKMLGGGENGEDLEKILDNAFKDLNLDGLLQKLGGEGGLGNLPDGSKPPTAEEQEEFAKMLKALGADGGLDASQGPPPDFMEKMVSKLESELGEEGMEKMMEGMMKQMFSKEVMYEPVCKVVAEYPNYLDRNKGKLNKDDSIRYTSQSEVYASLKKTYEEPLDEKERYEKVSKIMASLQSYGPPPEEISKLLTPTGPPGGMPPPPPGCPQQ